MTELIPGLLPHVRDEIYGIILAGKVARVKGKPRTENPYPEGTFFYSLWQDGWRGESCPVGLR